MTAAAATAPQQPGAQRNIGGDCLKALSRSSGFTRPSASRRASRPAYWVNWAEIKLPTTIPIRNTPTAYQTLPVKYHVAGVARIRPRALRTWFWLAAYRSRSPSVLPITGLFVWPPLSQLRCGGVHHLGKIG